MKLAVCIMDHWIRQEGLDAHLVCVYHDEYSFEVAEGHAQRVAFLSEEAIRVAGEMLNMTVPMSGEAQIGKNWAECH